MKQAMQILGYEKDDLDTRKRKENFREADTDPHVSSPNGKDLKTVSKELRTIDPIEVDEQLLHLRFKHY